MSRHPRPSFGHCYIVMDEYGNVLNNGTRDSTQWGPVGKDNIRSEAHHISIQVQNYVRIQNGQFCFTVKESEVQSLMKVKVNGERLSFPDAIGARVRKIVTAGKVRKKCRILYLKKSTNNVVRRIICPYSYRDGMVFATDERKGKKKIRSYRIDNIKSVTILTTKYKPIWEIEL